MHTYLEVRSIKLNGAFFQTNMHKIVLCMFRSTRSMKVERTELRIAWEYRLYVWFFRYPMMNIDVYRVVIRDK